MSVLASLQSHLRDFQGRKLDRPQLMARFTERLAGALGCDRASIWRLSPSRDQLICEDLYLAPCHEHRQGEALLRSRFPAYFWCLEDSRVIVAAEARSHGGLSCLLEDYLLPMDIHSLLDSAILRKGVVEGLVRCERTGRPGPWAPADLLGIRMATMLVGTAGI